MNTLNRIAAFSAIVMLLSLSGCVVGGGGHSYGDNRGDNRIVDPPREDRRADQQRDDHRCDGPGQMDCSR